MKNHIRRDIHRRRLVEAYEVERRVYKAVAADMSLPKETRKRARLALALLPRNSAPCRVRNRCVLSGRPRGVYSHVKLSRLCFRELARKGDLPGMMKASW
jgi:small subunit ribosomal protein S14